MSGAIPPLPQHAYMVWCSVKAQGHFLYCTRRNNDVNNLYISPNIIPMIRPKSR